MQFRNVFPIAVLSLSHCGWSETSTYPSTVRLRFLWGKTAAENRRCLKPLLPCAVFRLPVALKPIWLLVMSQRLQVFLRKRCVHRSENVLVMVISFVPSLMLILHLCSTSENAIRIFGEIRMHPMADVLSMRSRMESPFLPLFKTGLTLGFFSWTSQNLHCLHSANCFFSHRCIVW